MAFYCYYYTSSSYFERRVVLKGSTSSQESCLFSIYKVYTCILQFRL